MLPVILFIFSLILLWIIQKKVLKGLDIPGPKGVPIFGNAFELSSQTPYVQLHKWSKKYGGVFKIQIFNEEIVVLNENDAVREALLSEDFAGRPYSWRTNFSTPGGYKDIAFRDSSQGWKKLRKIAHRGLKQFGDGMGRIAVLASDDIQDCIMRFKSNGETPFDPREAVEKCLANIMSSLLVGERIDESSEDYHSVRFIVESDKRIAPSGPGAELDMFPWLRFFGNESYKILKETVVKRNKLFSSWMEKTEYKINLHSDESRSVCEVLQQHHKQGDITKDEVYGVLQDLLIAGIATTSTTLKAFLLILVNKPDVQKKIQAEIDDVIGDGRLPTFADRHNMPYSQAAVLEILRYSTTTTLSVPHKTLCDTSVGGYKVPSGTMVLMNLWALHHDEKYFDEPYEFKVERFLDDNGKCLSAHERKSFLPFGIGKRECLGEAMAKLRMFLFITSLLQKLDILPEDKNNPPDPDPTKFEYSISNLPGPFNIVVKDRENEQ
ncbi:unnamed protein product [Owenia fusiformis]|uniref:Uncharacterized protein n=1 Tax=Owenia fusiformis TaxID=6347 RepID=A0A8J1TVR1_OWEFU|nr:unnamed protein product [Owenia fusiformis]